MVFCKDVDLLYWEPDVLREAAFVSQTLDAGTGDVAGAAFHRVTGAAFDAAGVEAGQVLVLGGAVVGCFVVTGVTGPDDLAISVLYDDLIPAAGPAPGALGYATASGVTFAVRTFWAQRKTVSDLLLQAVGIVPGTAEALVAAVLNPEALRRACALGTLQMIYSAIAAAADEPAKFAVRADLYERLYRRALRQAQVDVDLDGDGKPEARRCPGLVRLARV
jgi:hypothetical protein